MTGKDLLKMNIPELFTNPTTILYVGASPHRSDLVVPLLDTGHKIILLERYYPNCKHFYGSPSFEWVIYGDVLDIWKHQIPLPIDVCIWWHGPEHVRPSEFVDAVGNLELIASSLVVLASPWGHCPQGDYAGNPHERHMNTLYERDYKRTGYETVTCGEIDKPPQSDIVAWKWVGGPWR